MENKKHIIKRTPLVCEFCLKTYTALCTHLRNKCRKGASDTEIKQISDKARWSAISCLKNGRTLDYEELDRLKGTVSMVTYLEAKGFIVRNNPIITSREELQDQSLPHKHNYRKEKKYLRYKRRVKKIIRAFPAHRPSIVKLTKYIKRKNWKFSESEVKRLVETWKPRPYKYWEHCKALEEHILLQNWKGLKISTDRASGMKKVKTKRNFHKGELICDFHGEHMSANTGRKMQNNNKGRHGLFFIRTEKASHAVSVHIVNATLRPIPN